ncbi:peroxiredoxin family protein [Engelhardtia mirabilis]|uniref:Uncharacterized protein n=1 Tax=Engelhardtia mirabilis TaxID=2528011 RepID=A0A518BEW9_9BACT|nr:hypothetical protein Pla133_05920 [Planctomycetes bacterium Pla133]QDU99853.1 hypothetical protein Pla86_05920 [Planctomycetes bacterium Pla86]
MIKLAVSGLGLASLLGIAMPAAPAVVLAPATVFMDSTLQEAGAWQTLVQAYDAAVEQWQAKYDEAGDLKVRRALRQEHPAIAYWGRVGALADAGEGRALVWQLENAGLAGHTGAEGRRVKAEVYGRLFPEHVAAEWFEAVVAHLASDRRAVGDELFERYLRSTIDSDALPEAKARALVTLGSWLLESDDAATAEGGWPLLERAASEFGATEAGAEAGDLIYVRRNLIVGAIAPDFEGTTIDGTTFHLADHRGKVVVLDFFGFW